MCNSNFICLKPYWEWERIKISNYYILVKEKLLEKTSLPPGAWSDQHRPRGGRGWGQEDGLLTRGLRRTGAALMRGTLLSGGHALVTGAAVLVVFWKVACWTTNISVIDDGDAILKRETGGVIAEVVSGHAGLVTRFPIWDAFAVTFSVVFACRPATDGILVTAEAHVVSTRESSSTIAFSITLLVLPDAFFFTFPKILVKVWLSVTITITLYATLRAFSITWSPLRGALSIAVIVILWCEICQTSVATEDWIWCRAFAFTGLGVFVAFVPADIIPWGGPWQGHNTLISTLFKCSVAFSVTLFRIFKAGSSAITSPSFEITVPVSYKIYMIIIK